MDRKYLLITCLLAVSAIGFSAEQADQPQREEPKPEATITVEAFLVQAELDAPYKAGMDPLGKEKLSVEPIYKTLKNGSAEVIDSTRLTIRNNVFADEQPEQQSGRPRSNKPAFGSRSETKTQKKLIVKHERENVVQTKDPNKPIVTKNITYNEFSESTSFSVYVYTEDYTYITASYNLDMTKIITIEDNEPPTTWSQESSGTIVLKKDTPMVVSSSQDGNKVNLLILCAEIEKID